MIFYYLLFKYITTPYYSQTANKDFVMSDKFINNFNEIPKQ